MPATHHKSTPRAPRAGYTLIELLAATASSAILVAGSASTLYIASRALDTGADGNRHTRIAAEVLGDMMADVRHARRFTERTATAITFTVPDRDGDGQDETLRYAWSGTPGDPLTYEYNGGGATTIAADVQAFNLTSLTREMVGPVEEEPEAPGGVVFEESSPEYTANGVRNITMAPPSGTVEGDLLVAVVAQDGMLNGMSEPAGSGWQSLDIGANSYYVTLGVWWKIAGAADAGGASSYQFSWGSYEDAYGMVMRFSGHAPDVTSTAAPLASRNGYGPNPISNAVNAQADSSLVLRIAAIDGLDVPDGVDGHTSVTMGASGTFSYNAVTGGAAYKTQSTAGDSGSASFNLNASHYYRTVTLAITPEGA